MITTIAGGVGAARMLAGLSLVADPSELTAIVNVGDDLELHGLHISPDLDTVTYTLADAIDPSKGWGLRDESWQARTMLEQYGGVTWFGLGDRDLGTHLYRTHRLGQGADLATVTAEIASAWGLRHRIMPATCDRLRTMITLTDGSEITFQEYFVERQHSVPIMRVRFDGADMSRPSPGVLDAIRSADRIVIAPSNPIVSIAPVLAVPGVRDALVARRSDVVAVSPIVDGAVLKGPADRMLTELGHEATVVGIARMCTAFASTLVIDDSDAALASDVEATGMQCVVTPTIMSTPERAASLARIVLDPGGTR